MQIANIRWKRSTGDYVESHCGRWWITPIYGGCTRPESYELRLDNQIVGSGTTQRECKEVALVVLERRGSAPSITSGCYPISALSKGPCQGATVPTPKAPCKDLP